MTYENPTPAPPAPPSAGPRPGEIDWQKLFLSFEGRIRRQHFWIAWLIIFALSIILGWIPIIGLLTLVLIWPSLAIQVNDMGKSGWLVVIPFAVTLVGGIFAVMTVGMAAMTNSAAIDSGDPAAMMALMGPMFGIIAVIAVINLGFLLWIGISEGQSGTNRFGPNPKDPLDVDRTFG